MSIVVVGSVAYDTIETQHGRADNVLGGSTCYFAVAARFFSPVSIVGVVGNDFRPEDMRLFTERGIDVRGLERREGLTMHWRGRYHEDMNKRDTLELALNVFADFAPELLPDQRRADYVFLGNIAPELQSRVLSQIQSPKVVAADTMNYWIENERPALMRLLGRVNILTVNDDEARALLLSLDPLGAEVRHGVGRPWWAKVAGTVGPSTVVVLNVFREYHTQLPLAEDQHAVGDFGSKGAATHRRRIWPRSW